MKKTIQLLAFIVCCLALTQFATAQKMDYETKLWWMRNINKNAYSDNIRNTEEFSKPQTDEPVTLEMLNAPKGIYRSYEDFVNKKVEPMTYLSCGCGHAVGKFFTNGLKFEDPNKKTVTIKPDEIWGFVDVWGQLNRMGKFFNKHGMFYVSFRIEYVSDYILYHPDGGTGVDLRPWQWASKDLKSPIVEADYFFQHNKTKHTEVANYQNECEKKAPRGAGAWYNKIEDCELESPNIRFLFVGERKDQPGSYRKGGMN